MGAREAAGENGEEVTAVLRSAGHEAAKDDSMATDPARRRRLQVWTIVYALNLVVPAFLGWEMTERGGRIGMAVAVIAGWTAGTFICHQSHRLGVVLVRGGARVAASQFVPVLQLGAGIVGILCWNEIAGHGSFADGGLRAELSGFALTLFVGSILFLAAMLFGGGFRLLFGSPEIEGDAAVDYAEPFAETGTVRPDR